MIHWMFDTNTCIFLIKHNSLKLLNHLTKVQVGEIGISSIVLAELWYGIEASRDRKRNEAALNEFLLYAEVLAWPEEAAPIYGRIREQLKKIGTPVGANDLLIAAHAMVTNTILVTDNMREFRRINGLKLENWIR